MNKRETVTSQERANAVRRAIIVLILMASILLVFGIIMVYSATAPASINSYVLTGKGSIFATANKQLVFGLVGVVLALIASFVPLRWYYVGAPVFMIVALVLQALIFSPLGVEVSGNKNWIMIAGNTVQPSEFLKLALIVFLARDLRRFKPGVDYKIGYFFWSGLAALATIIVVMGGGDLGTALIFAVIIVGMFWISGGPTRYVLAGGLLGVMGIAALVAYRPSRLNRFIDYFSSLFSLPDGTDPTQIDYSLWAFGSGGIAGSGIGTGTEKWPGNLAEAQTDFIFAVIGEEFGLAGTLGLIGVFIALGWSLFQIARYHTSRFGRLVVIGLAVWLCGQALGNMLVVTGLVPVFGVPLPFISQGGSSLIASLLAIGIALSAAFSVDGVRESFQVRRMILAKAQAIMSGGKQ